MGPSSGEVRRGGERAGDAYPFCSGTSTSTSSSESSSSPSSSVAGEAEEGSSGKAESAPEASSSSASRRAAKSSLPLEDEGDGDGASARLMPRGAEGTREKAVGGERRPKRRSNNEAKGMGSENGEEARWAFVTVSRGLGVVFFCFEEA